MPDLILPKMVFMESFFSPGNTIYIDPYQKGNTTNYIVYNKRDYVKQDGDDYIAYDPIVEDNQIKLNKSPSSYKSRSGDELRVYRLAMAATGEYTQFHGGTVADGLSAIVTTMNRINGIYEQEVSIRMILVANTDLVIYTNGATDPYTNNNGSTMLNENQINITNVIGTANYDIGHVFSTGGGGIANLESPCKSNSKARGVTGLGSPIGDSFDVDYVAHEMGHQFGGTHTWNYCGFGGGGTTDYEPGSATTIMGYAGLCGSNNIQQQSDDYFHVSNIEQIIIYTNFGPGNNCPTVIASGNSEPTVDAGSGGFTIPISTPFKLNGSAMDPDNDPLSFCWEQYDLGPGVPANSPSGNAPLFRSFPPTSRSFRIFPQMSDVVENTQTIGEFLPDYSRQMIFRLTARDHQPAGGGVAYDTYSVTVSDAAGPFLVEHPDTSNIIWETYAEYEVKWDVSNTNVSPINSGFVNILLSADGGYTYPTTLISNVPNIGAALVEIPPVSAGITYRVKVESADNLFFDISNTNFEIIEGDEPIDTTPTGISTIKDVFDLEIFPNPSNGLVNIIGRSNQRNDILIDIIDAQGKSVKTLTVGIDKGTFNTVVNLSDCSIGIYLIQLITTDQVITKKIVTF